MASSARQNASLGMVGKTVSYETSDAHRKRDAQTLRRKVVISVAALVAACFFSLCFMGAAGQYYPYSGAYAVYTPAQVAYALWMHIYNAVASVTHAFPEMPQSWLVDNVAGYYAIFSKLKVVGITLVSAVLLSVSGMLYQNVFKNPIAGPGMLGVGSGVSLGVASLVFVYGPVAASMIKERYIVCYAAGAAILVFVILAAKRLSGKGRPYDIVTLLLVGSILSQLIGSVVTYLTLFVMDEERYLAFYTISQMLTVDTSLLSWTVLGVAAVASIVPIYCLRFKMNALAFRDEEVRMFGVNALFLRSVALICGAIMILAAQIHVGMVSLVSLCVPFLARSWFGCEFRHQLIGNACIGMVLLVVCRTLVDMIPFVGDGLAIGSLVSVVMLPLFLFVMARQARAWE